MSSSSAGVRPSPYLLLALIACCGGCASLGPRPHEMLQATLWMQHAAEYAASTRQVYQIAEERAAAALLDPSWSALDQGEEAADLPVAVIVDVDETVLDNSPYQADLILTGESFSEDGWNEWAEAGKAPAMPGAHEFLDRLAQMDVEVFYVTNRHVRHKAVTRANLLAAGFPVSEEVDVVLTVGEHGWTEDKEPRRRLVAQTHRVVLLLGDDLNDFVSARGLDPAVRLALIGQHQHRWGVQWLVLPNPSYGSWEGSLVGQPHTRREALRIKLERLRRFQAP